VVLAVAAAAAVDVVAEGAAAVADSAAAVAYLFICLFWFSADLRLCYLWRLRWSYLQAQQHKQTCFS
jgi:hypothetical protein